MARFKLIIFNIEKSANIGVLMRAAYAFGCHELIVVGRKRFKVTGSSHSHRTQKWTHFYSLQEAVDHCKTEGFRICGIEIGAQMINETTFDQDVAFILGNEGRGISDAQKFCEQMVTVPQWRGMPSLNVAIAGGIVMYEFQKQQNCPYAKAEDQRYYDNNYHLEDQG